jgi:predicted TIM-barrel fold metal-dependent hydrolase
MSARRAGAGAAVRARLDHPVVDADGHFIETAPVMKDFFLDYVKQLGGGEMAQRLERSGGLDYDETVLRPWAAMSEAERNARWVTRPPWWTLPAGNTLDRATAHLPRLLHERLDDFGIVFAVLYPSRSLTTTAIKEEELRRVACRALNAYHAQLFAPFADRMTPVAQIPTHTPGEAIAELEHAVAGLGMKAVMLNGLVHRPIGDAEALGDPKRPNWGAGSSERIDALGLDSAHDYDPVWAKCVQLRVAPASHTPGMGWGSRRSVSSYMYNHIGSFAASMDAFCKALFLGGVTRRFPQLCFGFLEGGVAWACTLFAELLGHWEKRNVRALRALDPASIDVGLLLRLVEEYGDERFKGRLDALESAFSKLEPEPPTQDEWAACEIERAEDIRELFVPRFYFGCEADDPTVAWAFDSRVNPMGSKLHAMFSSDIGHWDVPEMGDVVADAYELVEQGLLAPPDFRDFVFANPVRFYTSVNPDFFRGTRCEAAAAQVVAARSPA